MSDVEGIIESAALAAVVTGPAPGSWREPAPGRPIALTSARSTGGDLFPVVVLEIDAAWGGQEASVADCMTHSADGMQAGAYISTACAALRASPLRSRGIRAASRDRPLLRLWRVAGRCGRSAVPVLHLRSRPARARGATSRSRLASGARYPVRCTSCNVGVATATAVRSSGEAPKPRLGATRVWAGNFGPRCARAPGRWSAVDHPRRRSVRRGSVGHCLV